MRLLYFYLQDLPYAIKLNKTKSVIPYADAKISKVYNQDSSILGVTAYKNEVIAVVDLNYILFNKTGKIENESAIVVIKSSNNKLIGITLSNIRCTGEINNNYIDYKQPLDVGIDSEYIFGLYRYSTNTILTILNIDRVLNRENFT